MISAAEAKQLSTPITIEEIEARIRQRAPHMTDTTFPLNRWNPELEPVLAEAGYVVKRGGLNDEVVIVEWK